jgi:hypothetical protein
MESLNDTVPLMQSEDYRERFKAEYLQLRIRTGKLGMMLARAEGGVLDFTPKVPLPVLQAQYNAMNLYLRLLESRAEIEEINLSEL